MTILQCQSILQFNNWFRYRIFKSYGNKMTYKNIWTFTIYILMCKHNEILLELSH